MTISSHPWLKLLVAIIAAIVVGIIFGDVPLDIRKYLCYT